MISDDFWGWDISLEVGQLCENAKKPEKNWYFMSFYYFSRGFSVITQGKGRKVSKNEY